MKIPSGVVDCEGWVNCLDWVVDIDEEVVDSICDISSAWSIFSCSTAWKITWFRKIV